MAKGKTPTTKAPRAKREPVAYKDNAHRFQVLARKRVNKALKQISLIGNLSGFGYEYTDEQVEKIRVALDVGCAQAMTRFDNAKKKPDAFDI